MGTELTTTERELLAKCEKTIAKYHHGFLETGSALLTIREQKLFKATHATFTAYCDERWHFTDSRARQLIAAAKTAKSVTTVTVSNERQARKLASALKSLPPEQREACQADYADLCRENGEEPTAEGLQEAVDLYVADNEPPDDAVDASEPEPEPEPDEPPDAPDEAPTRTPQSLCEEFWDQIEVEIRFWLGKHRKDAAVVACRLENLAAAIRNEG